MSNNENSKLVVVQNFIDGQFEASDTYLDSLEPGNGRHSVQINEKNKNKVPRADLTCYVTSIRLQ